MYNILINLTEFLFRYKYIMPELETTSGNLLLS